MPASKSRFVTACQQLLALGAVLAVLTPAASVITLDVVHEPGAPAVAAAPASALAAYAAASAQASLVPAAPVEATVDEVALTAPAATAGARVAAPRLQARRSTVKGGRAQLVSTPQPVTGYGTVGVTWAHGAQVPDDEIGFRVRMLENGAWTGWRPMVYHDEHAPDPGTREARRARPGTDELIVGDVDQVQVKVISDDGSLPADMKLAVVDPGEAPAEELETAAIDTGVLAGEEPVAATTGTVLDGSQDGSQDAVALRAARFTPRPTIYSRAQWGADESLRDRGSLHYYEVHAGFVHHTVNANNYTKEQVPGILRSIYAYHTKSRGWSDVGYNYLVDRFGRIWEGRAGGVDRPVVGAHTLGYNDYSFAMSAIGNFDVAKPSSAMVQAYGALFAWKLSLHGVSAASTAQAVGSKTFQAINGHRDAGSTACPGKYLYAKIPKIRQLAATAQQGWSGRELESNLAGSAQPDLVVRRSADKRVFVLPLELGASGAVTLGAPIDTGRVLADANRIMNVGDWNRDGFGDVITRTASTGALLLRPGDGTGRLGASVKLSTKFKSVSLLTAAGDMTGDGWPDLMGQLNGKMRIWPGRGARALGPSYIAHSKISASRQIGIGRWDADGAPDILVRRSKNLKYYAGNGPGGLTTERSAGSVDLTPYDWVLGVSDVGLTGHADVVVRGRGTGQWWLLPGETTGVGAPQPIGVGAQQYDLAG
jgi:hypothetical protein